MSGIRFPKAFTVRAVEIGRDGNAYVTLSRPNEDANDGRFRWPVDPDEFKFKAPVMLAPQVGASYTVTLGLVAADQA